MIENSPFWYVLGILFIYSIFDIKKQRKKYKNEKSEGFDYLITSKIYYSEIGVILVGFGVLINEVLIIAGI